ncbi:DUF547 domain-containing protein [Christiangramia salexigens]|uniref:DUF547 domain-containing protein n=1 Tax=Christiangramia salexigens TaxID=1913577 RepID=A0A1L3J604_9FLAO|nr:DUF547 domain-containing protein [Christiangramia salexigens]APG60546.1 hypothetical protein LPB144_09085 [Christiangramia salexigens]
MKKFILSFAVLISGVCMFASCNLISSAGFNSKGLPTPDVRTADASVNIESTVKLDHSLWDELLQKHVKSNGLVDYKGFKKDRAKLDRYLEMLSSQKPTDQWSSSELLAYYINLYNAYTVDLILKNYPLKSIKDINGPWTKEFVKVGNKKLSLGAIENSILRKMNEPRIHFAINCASISCPKLMNEAFTADKIEQQLEKATREFVNSDKNDISVTSAKLSSIFDWYKGDFTENGMTLINYVNQYAKTKINKGAEISYKNYDWNLNEVK